MRLDDINYTFIISTAKIAKDINERRKPIFLRGVIS